MDKYDSKEVFTVGALIRGQFRRVLNQLEFEGKLSYTEDKGWLDSAFYVRCSEETLNSLYEMWEDWEERVRRNCE